MTHYAARTDGNHALIRLSARKCGYLVIDTFRAGQGAPDLLIATKSGVWLPVEIKEPGGRLTAKERTVADACANHGAPYLVVHSWDELAAELEKREAEA